MYEFLNSSNADEFESFVSTHENGSFMQSPIWGNVKANWESEGLISRGCDGRIRGTCLVLIKRLPLCSMLYAPRGPVCDYNDAVTLADIVRGIDDIAKKYHAFAAVCDPPVSDVGALRSAGFLHTLTDEDRLIQCRSNYILDLNGRTPDDIRAHFKPEYRNRISKAQRRGVWCKEYSGENAVAKLDDFYSLMIQTGKRDGFPIRSKEYFANFIRAFGERSRLFMCYAKISEDTVPLSGAITVNYGGKFSYVYGASGDLWRDLYPNYLMQQTMINAAVKHGCRVYDFGGVPFYDDDTRREYGMYRFKRGFGGEVVSYAGQLAKIYRPTLYRAAAFMKRSPRLLTFAAGRR